jgi:hypothetical protein
MSEFFLSRISFLLDHIHILLLVFLILIHVQHLIEDAEKGKRAIEYATHIMNAMLCHVDAI